MTDYPSFITPSTTEYCVAAGCAFERAPYVTAKSVGVGNAPTPRLAVPATDLCNWHHAQFPRVLADLVNLYPDLVGAVYVRTSVKDANERVSGGGGVTDVGASWNPHAATVLAELTDWTSYLVRMLNREHPSRVPLREDADVRNNLQAIARWYAGWWSRYPFVGPYILADALQHRKLGMGAMNAMPVRRVTLSNGRCEFFVEDDPIYGPIICGAPLYGIVRAEDHPSPSEVVCSTNPRHTQLARERWENELENRR